MIKINSLAIKENNLFLDLVKFSLLAGVAIIAPLISQQMVAGPIINAVLFISVVIFGARRAMLIGMLPSVIALSCGLLSFVMAPMVPFIILGNAILVSVFYFFAKKNYWLGVLSASFLKFVFLAGTSALMSEALFKNQIGEKIATMMSWPQFFTALAGGMISYLFLKKFNKA